MILIKIPIPGKTVFILRRGLDHSSGGVKSPYDDVIKWKHFPRYWPFVRGIHGEFPAQRPVTRSFNVFFDLLLNKRLSKQSWGGWLETLSRQLWCHCNDLLSYRYTVRHNIVLNIQQGCRKYIALVRLRSHTRHLGTLVSLLCPFLVTWFNLNPSMDIQSYALGSAGWNYLSIPKLQRCSRCSLGMDK